VPVLSGRPGRPTLPEPRGGAARRRGVPAVEPAPVPAVGLVYALLLLVGLRQASYPLNGLILGAAVVTGIVIFRQIQVIAENGRLLSGSTSWPRSTP